MRPVGASPAGYDAFAAAAIGRKKKKWKNMPNYFLMSVFISGLYVVESNWSGRRIRMRCVEKSMASTVNWKRLFQGFVINILLMRCQYFFI